MSIRLGDKVKLSSALVALLVTAAVLPAAAGAHAPGPVPRVRCKVTPRDPYVAGTVNLQEPNGTGGAPTGNSSAVTIQVRGSAYYPANRSTPSPLLVFVH